MELSVLDLSALEAQALAVSEARERLEAQRQLLLAEIEQAKEGGATWEQIGAAVGVTRQRAYAMLRDA